MDLQFLVWNVADQALDCRILARKFENRTFAARFEVWIVENQPWDGEKETRSDPERAWTLSPNAAATRDHVLREDSFNLIAFSSPPVVIPSDNDTAVRRPTA
jgi:hypothetical protein